jgi:hypothetical protein
MASLAMHRELARVQVYGAAGVAAMETAARSAGQPVDEDTLLAIGVEAASEALADFDAAR